MSACLEIGLDSECICLNPLAPFKAFYMNIHAKYLEKLAFWLPYFYRALLIWKGGVIMFCYSYLSLRTVNKRVFSLQNAKSGGGLSATTAPGSVENRE